MIRVYLDWNIIGNLKREEFQELRAFIGEYRDQFLFPYSPAHFDDLMKSYQLTNEAFLEDIENIKYVSRKHLLNLQNGLVELQFADPDEYLNFEKGKLTESEKTIDFEGQIEELNEACRDFGLGDWGTIIKELFENQTSQIVVNDQNRDILNKMFPDVDNNSTLWDYIKGYGTFSNNLMSSGQYYRDFRKMIGTNGLKVDVNSGNWKESDVVKEIDKLLKPINTNFNDYVASIVENNVKPHTHYHYFTTAYLVLDMVGYRADRLQKQSNNLRNIQTDADHAFYGAHCDFLVGLDKRHISKSKVLYSEYNINTKVFDPVEFLEHAKSLVNTDQDPISMINKVINFSNEEEILESSSPEGASETTTTIYKLSLRIFNYFNCAIYTYNEKTKYIEIDLVRRSENYSRSQFTTELDNLVMNIYKCFGRAQDGYTTKQIQNFMNEGKEAELMWTYIGAAVSLTKDTITSKPILTFGVIIEDN